MPLEKTVKDIPIVGGIGEGIDDKLLPDGRMLELRNCYHEKPGSLRKRRGSKELGRKITGAGEISQGASVLSHGKELLALDGNSGYSWSPGAGKAWVDQGKAAQVGVETFRVAGSLLANRNREAWDAAEFEGVAVFAYGGPHAFIGTVRPIVVTVIDLATGTELISNLQLDDEGAYPHVVAIPGEFVGVVWLDSTAGKIYWAKLTNVGTPDIAFAANVEITAGSTPDVDVSGDFPIAAQPLTAATVTNSPVWALSYKEVTTGDLVVISVTRNNGQNISVSTTAHPEWLWVAVNYADPTAPTIWTFWNETVATATSLKAQVNTAGAGGGGGIAVSPFVIETYAAGEPGPSVVSLSAIGDRATPTSMRVYWGVTTLTAGTPGVWPLGVAETRNCLIDSLGNVSGVGTHAGGVTLYGDCFEDRDRRYYLAYHIPQFGDKPCTAYVIDEDGDAVARFYVQEAAPEQGSHPMVRKVTHLGNGRYLTSSLRTVAAALEVIANASTQVCDLVGVILDMRASGGANTIVANETLFAKGGHLLSYDRSEFSEAGFHYGPGKLLAVGNASGSIASGDYNIDACYFWRDDEGNEYFSPLMQQTADLPVTVSTGGISLTVQAYRLTQKANVKILIFRTLSGAQAGPYYLAAILDNDTTAEGITTTLTAADASISSNATIYTTGGVLENIAPPPIQHLWDDGQTAYLIAADDRRSLWVSKPITSRLGIEWSGSLVARMPTGGELVAGGSIDGNTILFEERAIRVLLGSRPTATGGGGFTDTRPLSSEVGCIDPRSVVQFRGGIVFKSHRGISLLDRSLQVTYIGSPVEDHNEDTILAATVVTRPGIGHTRFLLDTGEVLVWDYILNAWSILDEPGALACATWQGHYASIDIQGFVRHKLDRDHYLDNDQRFTYRARIPWVKVGGLNGYQRTKRIGILGELIGPHNLDAKIYNGYDDAEPAQTVRFESADVQEATGQPRPYQARIRPQKQKATAISVEVEVDAKGEGLRLTGLSLELGVKKGQAKLKSGASG